MRQWLWDNWWWLIGALFLIYCIGTGAWHELVQKHKKRPTV